MATTGSAFESASFLGRSGQVGAYAFSETNVRFRFQAEGTAGGFVSADALGEELGRKMVALLRRSAIQSLQKSYVASNPLAEIQRFLGGVFPKGGDAVIISGQWSQAVLAMSRSKHFIQKGAYVIDAEWETTATAEMLNLMRLEAERLALKIIQERVYDTVAVTVDTGSDIGGNKSDARGKSIGNKWGKSGNKDFFGEYDRTETLINSFEVTPFASGFSIGFNVDMLKSESGSHGGKGVDYAFLVEKGHAVTLWGQPIPRKVEGRPFMEEIIMSINKMIEKAFDHARSSKFGKQIGDTVFAWITNPVIDRSVMGGGF